MGSVDELDMLMGMQYTCSILLCPRLPLLWVCTLLPPFLPVWPQCVNCCIGLPGPYMALCDLHGSALPAQHLMAWGLIRPDRS